MQLKSLNVFFFFLLLIGVGVAVFFIFQPFLTAILTAAILTVLLKRPYHFFERIFRGHRVASSLLTCLMAILIIVTPMFAIFTLAFNEANNFYHSIGQEGTVESFIEKTIQVVDSVPYLGAFISHDDLTQERLLEDVQQLSSNALGLIQTAYKSITSFVLWVFILFFTLFYFLIDGKKTLRYLMNLSPLKNEHDKLLIQKFVSISRATIKGNLVVGVIQGFMGGISFAIAGVPSPAIWGLIMVFFSVIPMIGAGIIWLPAGIILLLLGQIWQGVFILAFGGLVISSIDNILPPKLVGKDTAMHPLLIFFSTLGGIYLFGLPGFVMGPIIVSLFMALSDIYSIEFRDQLKEYNEA